MSGRKRSGAQNRKRKKEAEIAFKKSSVLLAVFLKKAKKEVEAPNTSSSESEDGGYQPSAYPYQPKKFWGGNEVLPKFCDVCPNHDFRVHFGYDKKIV